MITKFLFIIYSNAGTLLHLLKGSLGTGDLLLNFEYCIFFYYLLLFSYVGILAMPNAFSHAGGLYFFNLIIIFSPVYFLGYLVGSVGTVVIGILW
jgi:hypothetical protein